MVQKSATSITDALVEVSHALNSGANLVSILGTTKDVAVRLIEAERASIFFRDRGGKSLWTLLADGEKMIKMPSGKGIVGEVITSNSTINVADAAADSRFYSDIDKKTGYVTRNILCAPMCNRDGAAFGAIELLNKKRGAFTEEDERVLTVFGAQAGLAIEHVEMYEDLQQNLKQFQLLSTIQENINVAMDFAQIFREIFSNLLPLVGGLSGAIYIIVGGKETYFGYSRDDGLVSWEADEARPCPAFLKELIDAVGRVAPEKRGKNFLNLPGLVCVDLLKGEKSLGYLAVHMDKDESRLFNAHPIDYLKVIAAQTVSFLDKKDSLEEKKRSEKQALLGSMLSMIVHDMKNPLCGASGFAQLIQQKSVDDTIKKYSGKILDVLERLERMNNELLMYVRGDSVQLEKSEVGLKKLFEQLISGLGPSFDQMNIKVDISAARDEEVVVEADRDRLIRVFSNILANAREAIDKDGTINIELSKSDSMALVRISDSGRGMPAYIRQRVFEPFVTHGKKTGTGLGMAITRTIVERHGGSIDVESALGKGTTFIINLPVS